ncbi:MAG TPA: alpha/beta hydrolase-fold protein [Opitutaceae bacterium]|nr:alpha/beta hydrolase-fold protein [Opitutaceae bacterium]
MKSPLLCLTTMLVGTSLASAQPAAPAPADAPAATRKESATPAPAAGRAGGAGGNRPAAPLRDPLTPGYVKATELPDGQVPPMEADGNFIIGPTHTPAPEMSPVTDEAMKGTVFEFSLESADSKFYPGVARDEPAAGAPRGGGGPVGNHPQPYTRKVKVYVPKQYVPGTVAPVMITTDGDGRAYNVLDHLIPLKKLPVMIVVSIPPGGPDGLGGERNLEYDTVSGKYSDFVESEVLPMAEKVANVKLTKDPDGRAVMGTSSGAAASMTMAWFHPERYHRVLTFSGTFVNQQWPVDPALPHGAWHYHETLIPNSPVKPLRIYMECGDRDNFGRADGFHDWVQANENMAKVLAEKGYHYKFVFARNAGHTDRPTISELYPTALQWVWQGYPIAGK